MNNKLQVVGFSLGVTAIIALTVYAVFAFDTSKTQSTTVDSNNQLEDALVVLPDDWQKGNLESKVKVIEYSDLQCPACAVVDDQIVKPVIEQYSDKITFSYRHFPLSMHENAVPAAWASEAAGLQGKFWEMHDILFARQDEWNATSTPETVYKNYAAELGIDTEKFMIDYNSSFVKEMVQEDANRAASLDLNSTPTFFVNGVKVPPLRSKEDLENAIKSALE